MNTLDRIREIVAELERSDITKIRRVYLMLCYTNLIQKDPTHDSTNRTKSDRARRGKVSQGKA